MIFRSFTWRAALAASTVGFVTLAACSDDETDVDAQIRSFCSSYFSSSSFSCCSASEKSDPVFAARYKYASADDCYAQLQTQLSTGQNRRAFDAKAASSCLAHLGARGCGVTPLVRVLQAAESEGCEGVIAGVQKENQPCDGQGDCVAGLFCPPTKETGTSVCTKPARFNDACNGTQASSTDHPACEPGLYCVITARNPGQCPTEPCEVYNCVPLGTEGEACTGLECGPNLTCKGGVCNPGGLGQQGEGCTQTDQCGDGFYCNLTSLDPPTGTCEPRKAAGEACSPANNTRFECKGTCASNGACADFCGSG